MEINQRINRLIGQLKGIEKMVEGKRDCQEIVQQLTAIKKAVDGLTKEIIVSDVCRYISPNSRKKVQKVIESAINL